MGRSKVTVRYQRVEKKRPRKKHRWVDDTPLRSQLSPLARYVEENMADDLTPQELIRQFQEYDCGHDFTELAVGQEMIFDYCAHCGLVKKRAKRKKYG